MLTETLFSLKRVYIVKTKIFHSVVFTGKIIIKRKPQNPTDIVRKHESFCFK